MRIAVTGGSGRLGTAVIAQLAQDQHEILSLDRALPSSPPAENGAVTYRQLDLLDLEALTAALKGCQAVIHLAAYTSPFGQPPGVVYTNNTLASYHVLHAAAALGIRRVCLASSINALGGIGSRVGRFDYFPVDEHHPSYHADDYALSKWVMEAQADSFARRAPEMTIASLRLHALPDAPPELQHTLDGPEAPIARGLWGWTLLSEGARACCLTLQANFTGHEVFFITAPRTCSAIPTLDLARHAYPAVPVRGGLSGHQSFYDCSKAARLLGWVHKDV